MKLDEIGFELPLELVEVLAACPGYTMACNKVDLQNLAVCDEVDGVHQVAYDVPGKGRVVEAEVCRVKNGIAANYTDPYMRRRDPDCMVIADDGPTDKDRYEDRSESRSASCGRRRSIG
jgi:hypothetical protein